MKSVIAICLATQRKQKHPHFTSLNRNNKKLLNIAINKMYCSFDFALYSGHGNFELELNEVNEFLAKLELVPSWQSSTRTTEMIMEVLLPHSRPLNSVLPHSRGGSPTNSRRSSPTTSAPGCSSQVRSRSNSRSQRLIQCVFL